MSKATKSFDIDGEELTLEPALNRLQDPDGEVRRKASEALAATFRKNLRTFTLITNAMARSVDLGDRGLATGVTYVDKTTGQDREVKARVVALGCGALETTRLMLLSKSSRFPNGIANSSGRLGKNLLEHLDVGGQAFFPELSFLQREAGVGIHVQRRGDWGAGHASSRSNTTRPSTRVYRTCP